MQEMARGFSLFEETLLVFEAQDLNIKWYMKLVTAIQNAIQCYLFRYKEKKKASTQTLLEHFFKKIERNESRKEPDLCH